MSSKPWFAWFPADYKAKTAHLNFLEDAAYRRMLDAYYERRAPLPADPVALYRIIGAQDEAERKACDAIAKQYFTNGDGLLRQPRCDAQIAKEDKLRKEWAKAGKRGANARWAKDRVGHRVGHYSAIGEANRGEHGIPHPSLDLKTFSRATWESFRTAYAARYKTDPVRNAKVNSAIMNLVKRLGPDAANVAAFYLTHNDQFYVKKRHPVTLLLSDAEGLHTQWKTGSKATALEARSAEQKDSVVEQIKRVQEKMKGEPNPWTSSQHSALPTQQSGKK